MKTDFVHLHFHSDFSFLQSTCSIKDARKYCDKKGYPALGLTDEGNMCAAVKFYKECKKEDDYPSIKPIIGSTFYVTKGQDLEERDKTPLILLAQTNEGYHNLKSLSNDSNLEENLLNGPTITMDMLKENSEGLICISCDINGAVQRMVRRDRMGDAYFESSLYKEIFGDNYYIELEKLGMDDEDETNEKLLKVADKVGSKCVAGNDVHYYDKDHFDAYVTLLAMKKRSTFDKIIEKQSLSKEAYLKDQDEMKELFKEYPKEILHNTVEIAESCNVDIEFGGMKLPNFELPNGFQSDIEYIKHLSFEKLKSKNLAHKPEYVERLNDELFDIDMIDQIKGYNFARYFLIVWDYINYAESINCRTGIGRGCFIPSSKVNCKNEIKEIQNVEIDDEVLSYDGKYHKVLNTLNYKVNEDITSIELEDGRIINCTSDHEIHVLKNEDLKWVMARDLNREDKIYDIKKGISVEIKSINEYKYSGTVHDLTIKDIHSYNIEGLSVHNSACGSLLLYCLDITNIDPVKYGLHFWRFLTVDKQYSISTKDFC